MAPRTVAEVARAAFIAQLQAYRINLPGTLVGTDPIYLHDLRVANRRIRSGLTEFKGLFRPRDLDFFQDEFRWVQNETNRKRDLDVFLEQLPPLIEEIPPEYHPQLTGFLDQVRTWQSDEQTRLAEILESDRFLALLERWQEVLDENMFEGTQLGHDSAREYGCRRIIKRYRQSRKRGQRLSDQSPQEHYHSYRIGVKKLRYAMEFFQPELGDQCFLQLLRSLKTSQDAFGLFHDRMIQLDFISRCVGTLQEGNPGPGQLDAVGQLVDQIQQKAQNRKEDSLQQARWLISDVTARSFQQCFQYPVGK